MPNRILTADEMYACDSDAIAQTQGGSYTLMSRAAAACLDVLRTKIFPSDTRTPRVLVLCGTGNNGGDGYALAKLFCDGGILADVRMTGETEKMSPECRRRYEAVRASGIRVYTDESWQTQDYTCIVDALLGIGVRHAVREPLAAVIRAVNGYAENRHIPVAAVDIPSGIDADTGAVHGTAVRATETICISHKKRGHILYPGTVYAGHVTVCDIGIVADVLRNAEADLPVLALGEEDIGALLPERLPDGNKGTFGRVVIFAGSKNMCGAAYLSAKAAYRSGAGLVEIVTVGENRIPLQTLLPEAVLSVYESDRGDAADAQDAQDTAVWSAALSRADAVVVGPGLGTSEQAGRLVRFLICHTACPTVVDADALNIIAAEGLLPAVAARADRVPFVLTPHPGEFSRLTGLPVPELKAHLIDTAVSFAKQYHIILTAKDARSVITDGETVYLNTSGSSALAKGGTGDILTGVTAALLAQTEKESDGMPSINSMPSVLEIAAAASYIHGLAGEAAERKYGARSVLAGEICDALAEVLMTESIQEKHP
ncbi:MAG: NAD(P)H-hydrate dehydratase [Eubacteriales bacterium]